MRAIILALACVLLGGCFMNNASPQKKFTDRVHELNDAVRWGAMGLASSMVAPAYRHQFLMSRREWGEVIKVADHEIVHLEITQGRDGATAIVSYQWYLQSSMTLRRTVVRQRWTQLEDRFGLVDEVVVQGDGRLLNGSDADVGGPEPLTLLGDPTDY
jgi:hypothetical protein